MHLGDYIVIEEQKGPYQFLCCSVSTGTTFEAEIDEDKRIFFDDQDFLGEHPHACSFLRPSTKERIVCTIHETSPVQCKSYRCIVSEIFSKDNTRIGYITGTGALHSDDENLKNLYEKGLMAVQSSQIDKEKWLADFFIQNGYLVK